MHVCGLHNPHKAAILLYDSMLDQLSCTICYSLSALVKKNRKIASVSYCFPFHFLQTWFGSPKYSLEAKRMFKRLVKFHLKKREICCTSWLVYVIKGTQVHTTDFSEFLITVSFCFLVHFFPFEVRGRMLEAIPAACG